MSTGAKPKRPKGLLWILWFKGTLAAFAILLGVWMLAVDEIDLSHVFVRMGLDQIGSDATGMLINFMVPYMPILRHDMVRAFAFGFIFFGIIKLFLVVELWRLEEWARNLAIGFFVLLLPVELAQLIASPSVTFSKVFSVAINMAVIWYLWKILPRALQKQEDSV